MKNPTLTTRAKESVRRDDDIMATNNSSIVSKRSVERIYYSDEPEFFRHFVKKPQRRSPIINRGYWLRMKAIDHVVRQFLEEPSEKRKFVVNLGCGYDPLPWQCHYRYPESCKNTTFIDIDYPPLLAKKCATVTSTSELTQILTNLSTNQKEGVILESDQYVQIGCDLRDIPALSKILASLFNLKDSLVLFTAEVSITYMRLPYADQLIQWAASFPDARFCLLEQILPGGPKHPFAQTMLAHFNKLQTALQSVELYPTTKSQECRFKDRGWLEAKAQNLWELWGSDEFLTSDQRASLDQIEPFDEWEEFALFGEHYFLLVASTRAKPGEPLISLTSDSENIPLIGDIASVPINTCYVENPTGKGSRRFGASFFMEDQASPGFIGVAVHAGMGPDTRMNTIDVYSRESKVGERIPPKGPSPRMCHNIVDLGGVALMSGGRTSPDNSLSDCWLYNKKENSFERVQDLPKGRFRHAAVALSNEFVLVFGGKSDSRTIEQDCLLWSRELGWAKIVQFGISLYDTKEPFKSNGDVPQPTFGATMVSHSSSGNKGLLMGGISKDGTVSPDIWRWKVEWGNCQVGSAFIAFQRVENTSIPESSYLARFGASAAEYQNKVYLVGGIGSSLLTLDTEVMELCIDSFTAGITSYQACPLVLNDDTPRPLLVGMSVVCLQDEILVLGGGAVCFSFGTYWNRGFYNLLNASPKPDYAIATGQEIGPNRWKMLEAIPSNSGHKKSLVGTTTKSAIPRIKIKDAQDFERIMKVAKPVIIEGLDLGICLGLWSAEYLKESIGQDRPVVVHEAGNTKKMDFNKKNFRYTTKPFGEFIDDAEKGGKLYLRALSREKPSELPTDLARDFPSISNDFRLPAELRFVAENAHSSPLRISGDIAMWLHYDVMANILCQIKGSKRILVLPPSDIQYLSFPPGASSSSIDVSSDSIIPGTHPHEAILDCGEVLFIPALWLHATIPTGGLSVAINVFFRNLQTGYAAGRDVYGNRDLAAYEKGRLDVGKLAKSFEKLPPDMREFYLLRLAEELREMAISGV